MVEQIGRLAPSRLDATNNVIRETERHGVAVCVKQIPDPAAPPKLSILTTNTPSSVEGKLILDDSDSSTAWKMGLQLAEPRSRRRAR